MRSEGSIRLSNDLAFSKHTGWLLTWFYVFMRDSKYMLLIMLYFEYKIKCFSFYFLVNAIWFFSAVDEIAFVFGLSVGNVYEKIL